MLPAVEQFQPVAVDAVGGGAGKGGREPLFLHLNVRRTEHQSGGEFADLQILALVAEVAG